MSKITENTILVTGIAGFIGFHVAEQLLKEGHKVIGIDCVNDYYDPTLKQARLKYLDDHYKNLLTFHKINLEDREAVAHVWKSASPKITHVIHLAAQAGVRYSLINPYEYINSNVMGHLVLLEQARHQEGFEHFVYASSSSVYGANEKMPFSEADPVNQPMALYAATKRCDELMSYSYSHLYDIPTTGLRFFTVYGPWGRPDMALFIFTKKILAGEPIPVFNNGKMKRDFTYIDDIKQGVLAALRKAPKRQGKIPPQEIYNLGNSRSEHLTKYIQLIEQNLGKKANLDLQPMQPGDVPESYSNIDKAKKDLGYSPKTNIDVGIQNFISWYKTYYTVD
jgi:UDP-glucuronate 4-epimerase